MTRDVMITYLFSKDLREKFKNNLETLTAYGIIGANEIKDVWYTDILKELKPIVEWLATTDTHYDILNWTPFFYKIIGIKDTNKFIEVILKYDVEMGW